MARHINHLALTGTLALAGCAHGPRTDCLSTPVASGEIERTVQNFFNALRKKDKAAFQRVTTSSFYSFDVGKRFAGTELVDVIRDAHARGVQLNWSIGPLDTKVRCEVAWAAWENVGSAGIPPDVRPVRWLESAVLVRHDGAWKIDFSIPSGRQRNSRGRMARHPSF